MGGEYRTIQVRGRNFATAWSQAQEIEEEEKGTDFYNGSIAHVDDVRILSDDEYKKYENGDKDLHKCQGVGKVIQKPIENDMKVKTSVESFPQKGTRQWETAYEVYEGSAPHNVAKSFKLQTEAINYARSLCEKNGKTYTIGIVKKLNTPSRVAKITYKKSSKQRDGVWEVYCLVPW